MKVRFGRCCCKPVRAWQATAQPTSQSRESGRGGVVEQEYLYGYGGRGYQLRHG